MSDINLDNLTAPLTTLWVICLLVPPVIIGALVLLAGIWVRRRKVLAAIYFSVSILAVLGEGFWACDFFNVPDMRIWTLPIAVVGTVLVFGVYALARWVVRRIRRGRLAS